MKYSKILLFLIIAITSLQAQFNSVRIASYIGHYPIPANYLQRAANAGYTHVSAYIGDPITTHWDANNGYIGGSGAGTQVDWIKQAFLDCHNTINSNGVRLKFIPRLPGASKHVDWTMYNNPRITYQYYASDLIKGIVTQDLKEDDVLLDFIENLMGKVDRASEYKISKVPAYAPNSAGLDKTFSDLIEDVVKAAFDATGLPSSEFDYIHLSNDEPVNYDAFVPENWKLLIGKNQEDLKWMYDHDPVNHYGVARFPIGTSLFPYNSNTFYGTYYSQILRPLVNEGRTTTVYNDYFYDFQATNAHYQNGVRTLIADYFKRRVQDIINANLSPNIKCIVYADIFDPMHLGGYFHTDQTVPVLATQTVTVAGVSTPITRHLVLSPWLYPNTWTHDPSAKFKGAKVNTTVTEAALEVTAGWLACSALSWPYEDICKSGVSHWVYNNVTTRNSVVVDLEYEAKGNYYNLETVMNHFMNSGFQFILQNSFEKEYATVHTLSQLIKVLEEPRNKLTTAQKNNFMLGYSCIAYGNESGSNTSGWDRGKGSYDQHFIYNNMELMSAYWNWNGVANTQLMFGDLANIPAHNISCTRNPVSVTDYFVTVKDPFNAYIAAPANSNMQSASFFEAILFCNQLSLREGLQPVYIYPQAGTNPLNNSVWSTWNANMTRNNGVSGPIILDAVIYADYSKNGYRLPDVTEMATIDGDAQFIPDPVVQAEWVWNSSRIPRAQVYSHVTHASTIPANILIGQPFRVVRNRINTPPTAVAVATPSSGLAPLSVAFSGTGSSDPDGDPLTFSWAFGDGATATGASISHVYGVAGTYTAVLTVADGNGGSNSMSVIIAVNTPPLPNRPPTASITATPISGSAPLTVAFSGTGSTDPDGDPLTFSWNYGDGTTGTGLTVNHVYTLAGTYTAVLTVSDGRGGTTTASSTITATPSSTLITGTGSYPVTPAGVTYRINNSSYHHGMMFTIRNIGLDDAVEVRWFGVLDQNNSNCASRVANLNGNGAQINNICTPKDASNDMYITLKSSKNCSVQLEIFNWTNGPGCP